MVEPPKPKAGAANLTKAQRDAQEEFERLLVKRFEMDPATAKSDEQKKALRDLEDRLRVLSERLPK
ncbi:MAG: hypothetical protein AB7O63_16525 [Reyranellaceae bacterium]